MTDDNILDPSLRAILRADALRPYDRYGKIEPTMEWLPLSGERGSDYECFFVRFKPGARSMPHTHTGGEEIFVIEGELEDCDGTVYRTGDYVRFEPGSQHHSHAPNGCLLLTILRGENERV